MPESCSTLRQRPVLKVKRHIVMVAEYAHGERPRWFVSDDCDDGFGPENDDFTQHVGRLVEE